MRAARGWILLLACTFVAPAAAQQADTTAHAGTPADSVTLQVPLDEAIRRALEVQPAMVQARGGQRNAGAAERTARGAFLPRLDADASRAQASANRFNRETNQIVSGDASNRSYSAGLSLQLDLFDGFRRFASVRAASAASDAADAGLTNQKFLVTLQTTQLFYDALARDELVAVAEAQVRRAARQFDMSVQLLRAGSATRSDSLRARVELGNARLALLQAQANLATAEGNLGRQIGVDQPVRALPDSVLPSPPDTTTLREEALRSAPQVTQAEGEARAARARLSVARAQYWPTLSATYSNAYSGLDAPWSRSSSYVNNWSLRVSLTWPLFDGFAREQAQVTAGAARDLADAQAADARRQVSAQLTQQLAALATASAQIDIARENVAAATEDLRVLQERYRLGASTMLDLLTSQANLTQAETNLVQARFNYLIARAQLEALVGRQL
jgi:outer membrane protein